MASPRKTTKSPGRAKSATPQPNQRVSHGVGRQLVLAPAAETNADPVLRAAYDSIMEVGVRRTTLADVARRAGVSRMTVYRKYDDLPRLLSALLTVELGSLLAAAQESCRNLATQREQLSRLITDTAAALAAHPVLARVLSVDPEALLPLIVDRFGSTQRLAMTQVHDMIVAGQVATGDGSIRAGDPETMALTLLVAVQSFVFSARAITTADPLGQVYPEMHRLTDSYLALQMTAP